MSTKMGTAFWQYTYLATVLCLMQICSGTAHKYDVIIVGAGASGLAAATRLLELNITNFIVLEAENRTGGRINSQLFAGRMVDMGAQWCHGQEGNIVYEIANPKGLVHHMSNDLMEFTNAVFDSYGNRLNSSQIRVAMEILYEIMLHSNFQEEEPNLDLKTYTVKRFQEVLKNRNIYHIDPIIGNLALDLAGKLVCAESGCEDWSLIPTKINFENGEGDQNMSWGNATYSVFLPILMRPNTTTTETVEERIHHNKEVKTIYWDLLRSTGASIECQDESQYSTDHVIVTVSLGVLQHRRDLFEPELPEWKTKAIDNMKMGCVSKIYLKFAKNWWSDNAKDGYAFVRDPNDTENLLRQFQGSAEENKWLLDIRTIHTVDFHDDILEAWNIGDSARDMERVPDQVVLQKFLQLLRIYLKNLNVPDPIAFKRTIWCNHEHFYGTYSFASLKNILANVTNADLGEPVLNGQRPVVLFAGEATSPNHFSTVQGAIESGYREAERLFHHINS